MGLNGDFAKSPKQFLAKHFFHVAAQTIQGTGNKTLGFTEKGGSVVLEPDSKGVKCFFLRVVEDKAAISCLDRAEKDACFFFTDTLTGCQFLAYGGSVKPTVEHDNNKSGNGVDYGARRNTAGNPTVCVYPGHGYNHPQELANVVGVKSNGLWQFLLQYGAPGAPKVTELG